MWSKKDTSHCSDQQLLDAYLGSRAEASDAAHGRRQGHFAECASCAARYADLARDFDLLTEGGTGEADAVFTDERLAKQRQRIARRLEHHGRRADVVLFPTRGTAQPVAGPRAAWQPWAAAAAVAGLVAGLVLGLGLDRLELGDAAERASTSLVDATTSGEAAFELGLSSEDELMEAIDVALTTRRVPELLALDEVTPERIAFSPRLR